MKILKHIGVKSIFKISLILGAVAGLLVGLMLGIASFTEKRWLEGAITIVLAPILYGVMGAIVNSIMAWIYNRVSDRLGGIEVELE